MSSTYEDRVTTVSVDVAPDLVCIIGAHAMKAIVTIDYQWIYTTVDGHPICPEHILLISDMRTAAAIPESRIKKILVDRDEERSHERVRTRLRQRSATSTPGWIYYLRVGDLIKIGFTEDVQRRIASYPPNAKLLALHPGTRAVEREMHQRFAELRARGREWFSQGETLDRHIADVVAQFGSPDGSVKPMRHVKAS